MFFLSGIYTVRYGQVAFWATPCSREVLKKIKKVNVEKLQHRLGNYHKFGYIDRFPLRLCAGDLRVLTRPTIWTQQVRFQRKRDGCPRLHIDMKYPDFDDYRKDEYKNVKRTQWGEGDDKMNPTYVIGAFGLICGMYSLKSLLIHYASYMAAAADVLALASIEVDLGKVAPGACVSYKWRGKPLFIKHRTQHDIEMEAITPISSLRDPQTPEQRTIDPQWLVVIGICTHLGCVPIPNSGDYPGGFYCPCHGSHYDNVGRTRKGPAPLNLEVPPYKFVSDQLINVG